MTNKERKNNLKQIQAAIKVFPKVLARKEKAAKERNKRLKDFASFSKELLKIVEPNRKSKK